MHTSAGHLAPGQVVETPREHPACSRVHRASQQARASWVQALSCPMEKEQSSPGELFWLDPCYKKMDQHLLQAKKLPMLGWGGQTLWQDCLLSHAADRGSRLGLWTQEGAGSQALFPSSWVICGLGGVGCCASELPFQR